MDAPKLTQRVKTLVARQGFDACGIAQAAPIGRAPYFRDWLNAGLAGTMDYLGRYADKRIDPQALLPGAKSVVVVALLYHQPRPSPPPDSHGPIGRVAMYAWGNDYHRVMKKKLFAVVDQLRDELATPFVAQVCVDTAPVIEREWAARAGVGWIGKNTLSLNEHLGSYYFLGEIVTSLDLVADAPAIDHCGTCTACLSACPTDAFPAPYEMDASKCISYLTIEHREAIDAPLQEKMGEWLYGCDICQEVCPHNNRAPHTSEPQFAPKPTVVDPPLADVLGWSEEAYRENLRGSAMKRAKLGMLKRNAAIVQRNTRRTDRPGDSTNAAP